MDMDTATEMDMEMDMALHLTMNPTHQIAANPFTQLPIPAIFASQSISIVPI